MASLMNLALVAGGIFTKYLNLIFPVDRGDYAHLPALGHCRDCDQSGHAAGGDCGLRAARAPSCRLCATLIGVKREIAA